MSVTTRTSATAVGISAGIGVLVLFFYAIALATLSDLRSSDAAGNAYAQAFGAIEIIVLWLLLAVLAIIAWAKGDMPAWTVIAAAILVPGFGLCDDDRAGIAREAPHSTISLAHRDSSACPAACGGVLLLGATAIDACPCTGSLCGRYRLGRDLSPEHFHYANVADT